MRKNELQHPARNPKSLRYNRRYMNDKIRVWAKTPKGRAAIKRKMRKRKSDNRAIVHAAKDNPCTDCGVRYPYYAMEFDHCRGKKEFDIGQVQARSVARLLAELAKCDLVCANCHKIRTFGLRMGK